MNHYFVYGLYDPITELPFYIGKGSGNRPYDHLKESKDSTSNIRKFNKIESLRRNGVVPLIKIIKGQMTELEALKYENALILHYGRRGYETNGILMNLVLDGNPPSNKGRKHTAETRKKMSESAKNKSKSDSHRENISKSKSGEKNPNWGKSVPEERKERIRKANIGQKRSDATRRNLSESHAKDYILTTPQGRKIKVNSTQLKEMCIQLGFNKTAFVNASRKTGKYRGWQIKS